MPDFAPRILDFPVRAAAIDDFRRQLKSRNLGDLSAVAAALGDAALFSGLLDFWLERGWVVRSPSSPVLAYGGTELSADLTLAEFCGESIEYDSPGPEGADASDSGDEPGGRSPGDEPGRGSPGDEPGRRSPGDEPGRRNSQV